MSQPIPYSDGSVNHNGTHTFVRHPMAIQAALILEYFRTIRAAERALAGMHDHVGFHRAGARELPIAHAARVPLRIGCRVWDDDDTKPPPDTAHTNTHNTFAINGQEQNRLVKPRRQQQIQTTVHESSTRLPYRHVSADADATHCGRQTRGRSCHTGIVPVCQPTRLWPLWRLRQRVRCDAWPDDASECVCPNCISYGRIFRNMRTGILGMGCRRLQSMAAVAASFGSISIGCRADRYAVRNGRTRTMWTVSEWHRSMRSIVVADRSGW